MSLLSLPIGPPAMYRFENLGDEGDGEPLAEKMARLTQTLEPQFEESQELKTGIRKRLRGLDL